MINKIHHQKWIELLLTIGKYQDAKENSGLSKNIGSITHIKTLLKISQKKI